MILDSPFATQGVVLVVFALVGAWCTLYFEHSTLCHRQDTIKRGWFFNLHVVLCWVTHFGSSPYQWAISHRLHHMFGDVKGLDPYSAVNEGYWRIFFNSAGHLGRYNAREGHGDIFPDLKPKQWEKTLYENNWMVLPVLAVFFLLLPWLIATPNSLSGWVLSTLTGAIAGVLGVFTVLWGGGLINSLAHSFRSKLGLMFDWYERTFALDGTTAQNRPLWGWFLRELWHRNHHDDPTQLNFGWRHWYQFDAIFQACRVWATLDVIEVGFSKIEANMENLTRWVRTWGDPDGDGAELEAHEARVIRHVPRPEQLLLSEPRHRRSAEIGMLIINGKLRRDSGVVQVVTAA